MRDLANMLVVRTGMEQEPHWNNAAENIIAAFTAYICACEGNPAARNLPGMRTLLASRDNYTSALENMRKITDFDRVLEQLGQSLTWHVDKELGSVMTHTQLHTNIFESPLVADCTGSTSFDPEELRTGRMTVYLVTPSDKLEVWAGLQRMQLGTLIRVITRGQPTEKNPVLFMVDEAAHIGQMRVIEDAVTLMRGMGIRLWLFFQSLDQLNKCFGERASTVLDNIGTQQYFGINSYETAEAISKRIGEQTIAVTTSGDNSGTSFSSSGGAHSSNQHGSNSGKSVSVSETARRLLKEDEILRLTDNVALVFHKNLPAILAERIKYYSDPAFRRRPILRSWGTGRSRGLGLAGVAMALAILLLAGLVTAFVASLPVPGGQQHPLSFLHGALAGPGGISGATGPSPTLPGCRVNRCRMNRNDFPYGPRMARGVSAVLLKGVTPMALKAQRSRKQRHRQHDRGCPHGPRDDGCQSMERHHGRRRNSLFRQTRGR